MKRFAQVFLCFFLFSALCMSKSAEYAFGAKRAVGEKSFSAASGKAKGKETKKAKKRSLSTIIKNSPREERPLPLTDFSSADIAEPGPRW